MKKLALASILSACALIAVAQQGPNGETVTINAAGLKINVPDKITSMSPDAFHQFTGSYDLSNGKFLSLFTRGLKKYAKVQGEPWHEIVATSSNSFVALDRKLEMKIERHQDGEVHGELLMVVAPEHMASAETGEHLVALDLH